jgi:serine/threonine protein kinase
MSDSIESPDVSFHRDFEQEGFLGSGQFADVYKAREKDGKSYAVKKSKRQFRSKKDRKLLMSEVMIMKRLGEQPCAYIVQLVRTHSPWTVRLFCA